MRIRHHVWLALACAALFGLRAPLCLAACIDAAAASEAVAESAAPPPCHGGMADDTPSSPDPDRAPAHECGCDEFKWVVASHGTTEASKPGGTLVLEPPPVHLASFTFLAPRSSVPRVPAPQDLPPPDVLLLKTTLLI